MSSDAPVETFYFLQNGYSTDGVVCGIFEALDLNDDGQVSSFNKEVLGFSAVYQDSSITVSFGTDGLYGLVYALDGDIGDNVMFDIEGIRSVGQATSTVSCEYITGPGPLGLDAKCGDGNNCGVVYCPSFTSHTSELVFVSSTIPAQCVGFDLSIDVPGAWDSPKTPIDDIEDAAVPIDNMGGVVLSDPHFLGLDGTQYDFMGIPGKIYSIITYSGNSFSYSLISRFGRAYTTGISMTDGGSLVSYKQKGTWMSSVVFSLKWNGGSAFLALSTAQKLDKKLVYGSYSFTSGLLPKVDEKKSSSELVIDLPPICVKLDVVPPLESWKVKSTDVPELSHINLQVIRLTVADVNRLSGVLGVSANGQYPSAETSEELFDAAAVVSGDVLSIVP